MFERLGPFFQRFDHDPRDVRPLFNPVDYVCFDGLTANRQVERITFVEVKCGTSRPSPTQRSIVEAIRDGRVSTEVWQFGERGIPIEQQLIKPRNTVVRSNHLNGGNGSSGA
jgi:predicted Holliday junction resolvase-like endonuclease